MRRGAGEGRRRREEAGEEKIAPIASARPILITQVRPLKRRHISIPELPQHHHLLLLLPPQYGTLDSDMRDMDSEKQEGEIPVGDDRS